MRKPEAQVQIRQLDGPAAAGYIGYAKNVAKQEYEKGDHTWEQATNDAIIRIVVTEGKCDIYIASKGGGVDMLSGMTDVSYIQSVPVNGSTEDQLFRFYPGSAMGEATRAFRREKKLAVEAAPQNVRIASTANRFGQTANVAPAMFTGKMCKIAQLAMGLTNNQIQYQHTFFVTHGIHTDSEGKLWLVEISAYDGVRAMKLPGYSRVKDKATQDLIVAAGINRIPNGQAFPVGAKLAEAVAAGGVRILMPASDLAGFYGNSPFYFDCGWAFSESGAEASNTSHGFVPEDNYRRSYLHKIAISGDATGPKSATLTLTKSGILWNNSDSTRFYVPTGVSSDLASFGMKMANTSTQTAPSANWGGPLHCFYVGDALQLYEHKVYPGSGSTSATDGFSPYDVFAVGGAVNIGSDFGYTPYSAAAFITCTNTTGVVYNDSIDFSGPGITAPEFLSGSQTITRRFESLPCGPLVGDRVQRGGGLSVMVSNLNVIFSDEETEASTGRVKRNSLVVSPRNRSCVFVGRYEQNGENSTSHNRKFAGFTKNVGDSYQVWTNKVNDLNPPTPPLFGSPWRVLESGSFEANFGFDYAVDIVGGGFGENPTFSQINVGEVSRAVSTSLFFPKGSNDPNSLDNEMTLSGSYNPPSGRVEESTFSAASDNRSLTVQNLGRQHVRVVTGAEEIAKFVKIQSVSPDNFGIYASMHSGRSAFLESAYHSKNQGSLSGEGLECIPADGEEMAFLSNLVSWVGYA